MCKSDKTKQHLQKLKYDIHTKFNDSSGNLVWISLQFVQWTAYSVVYVIKLHSYIATCI